MLAEFLDRVVELADQARQPYVMQVDQEPNHVYHLVHADGTVVRREAAPPTRDHRAFDLETLAAWVEAGSGSSVTWYCREGVVVLLDDDSRRDRLRLNLTRSQQVQQVVNLAQNKPWLKQKDFINLLRVSLHGCLSKAGALLSMARQVKFRQLAQAEQAIHLGKASLGKRIESELHGAEAFPEQVVLSVPLWENLPLPPQDVLCALDIDSATESFQIIPLPGEVEAALRAGEVSLRERLAELLPDGAPLYYGTP